MQSMLCDSLLVQIATHEQRQCLTQFSRRLHRYPIAVVFWLSRNDVLAGYSFYIFNVYHLLNRHASGIFTPNPSSCYLSAHQTRRQ